MRNSTVSRIFMALALVLAASCNRIEENVPSGEDGCRTVITAVADQIGAGSKVVMAYGYEALWQPGDQIHVMQGTTTDTFSLVGGDGTTTGTFEGTKVIKGEIEAFYPVTVGKTMTWPERQSSSQAMPMYAHQDITGAEGETVGFSSLGAMLQIVFNSTVENITLKSIELKDGGKDMSGPFTVDKEGKAVISSKTGAGIRLELGAGKALGKGANFFYLAIPAAKYEDLTFSFLTKDGRVCTMHSTTMPEIERNTAYRLTLTGTKFEERNLFIDGRFSVGGGRVVKFSRGNLYWNGETYEFEENQTDYPAAIDESHIGHFYWSNKAETARAKYYEDPDKTNDDVLFTNATESTPDPDFTVSDVTGEFRALSQLEWQCLIENNKCGWTSVCNKYCLAIAPDNYAGSIKDAYDEDAWRTAESEGMVFLPAAGQRGMSAVYHYNESGFYWSSAPWALNAQELFFYNGGVSTQSDMYRGDANAIRLVKDLLYAKEVVLDRTELTLAVHQNMTLTPTVLPADAPDKTVSWSSDNTDVATVDGNGKVSAVSAGTATITVTTSDRGRTARCTVTVEPVLPGVFTVDDKDLKVRFTRGNLYWNGSSFEFEESQIDYPIAIDESHIGHFYWSNKAETARAKYYEDPDKTNDDVLFTNATESTPDPDFTVSGVTGGFRTLSQLEWKYLIENNKCGWTEVCGKNGLAIAPDSFAGSIKATYDVDAWRTAEAEGMVFLPAAGQRGISAIYHYNESGFYWSSAPWALNAQELFFYNGGVSTQSDMFRGDANAIRLVKTVQ